jgi:hypothetical protein
MTITLNPFSLRVKETAYSFSEMMLVFSIFTKELGSINIFGVDFDLISYPFFVLFFISHLPQMIGSRQQPFLLYLYLIVSSLVSILLLGLQAGGFLKQFLPIVVIFSSMFVLVQKESIVRIFHLYTIVAYYTAIFGIIQVLLSFGGINLLIKIPGRLDSIAYEPSHYASILVPALVFSFFNFSFYRKQFFVMLTALFFTFNVTGYVVFLLILSVAFINPIYIIFSVPVIYVVLFYYLPAINPYFNIRFIDTLEVIQGKKDIFRSRLTVNGTTLSCFFKP